MYTDRTEMPRSNPFLRALYLYSETTLVDMLNDIEDSARNLLVTLLQQGFLPKNLLLKFHEHINHEQPLNEVISDIKQKRLAFLSTNMDKTRCIFENETLWYFVPSLCKVIETTIENTKVDAPERVAIKLTYNMKSSNEQKDMALLLGLLYEFCHPFTIKTSLAISSGSVGKVDMRVMLLPADDQCEISVSFPKDDQCFGVICASAVAEVIDEAYQKCEISVSFPKDDQCSGVIRASAVAEVIDEAYQSFLTAGTVTKTDHIGDYDLRAESESAHEEWWAKNCGGKRSGSSQIAKTNLFANAASGEHVPTDSTGH